MTGDPFDYRCHRCGIPLLDDVPFCSRTCEQAPSRRHVAGEWAARVYHWLFGDAGAEPETLWSVDLDDVPLRHVSALVDWLRLHQVHADRVSWPLRVRRERDGAYLVDAGDVRAPLIMPPPGLPGSHLYGTVRRRDIASPTRKARP